MIDYPAEFALRAWRHVVGGIKGASDRLAEFEVPFVDIFEHGRDSRNFDKSLSETLAAEVWTWPWFDEWEARFAVARQWPEMWPQTEPDADEIEFFDEHALAEFRQRAIAPLIAQTARHIAYRDMHLARAHPGQTWVLVSLDDVERQIADEHTAIIASGGLDQLPPFFPGDRTSLRMTPPLLGR